MNQILHYSSSDLAYLARFNSTTCASSSYLETQTYFLGCNPQVTASGYGGLPETNSVSLSCSAGADLTPLSVMPANALTYSVQM